MGMFMAYLVSWAGIIMVGCNTNFYAGAGLALALYGVSVIQRYERNP